jgi:purine-binding chemotaxis protein CheW
MEATSLFGDSPIEKQDGKHLVFILGGISYGIAILEVSEINGLMEVTPVPRTPSYIKGVINLRGKVIPVMDLRLKFGMPEKEYDKQTCIIIVNIPVGPANKQMGVLVDTVSEVFDIPLSEIEAPPEYGTHSDEGFLSGIGKVKGKLVMLLNIKKVLHTDEIIKLLDKKDCIENQ